MKFYLRRFRGDGIYMYKDRHSQKVKVCAPFRGHTLKPFSLIAKYAKYTVYEPNIKLCPRIAYYQ